MTKAQLLTQLKRAERILRRIANVKGSHEGNQQDAERFIYGKVR